MDTSLPTATARTAPAQPAFPPWHAAYYARLNASELTLVTREVRYIKMFGALPGFVVEEIAAHVAGHPEKPIPGLVLISGDAVAVLLVGRGVAVLTRQLRVGALAVLIEVAAGIIDDAGCVRSAGLRELKEETGVVVDAARLRPLGAPFFTSPGRTTERIFPMVAELDDEEVSSAAFEKLVTRKGLGLAAEGEFITLTTIPLGDYDAFDATGDCKAIICHSRYMRAL